MNEELIRKLHDQAWGETHEKAIAVTETPIDFQKVLRERFAELIVRECIDKIETYRIPVGNSAAGEMACEWTYDALKEIRDDIKEMFGVE